MKSILLSKVKSFRKQPQLTEHLASKIRNPNSKGSFYNKTRLLRTFVPNTPLANVAIIKLLRKFGYDGIVFKKDGQIILNVFFQRRKNALYMFGIEVEPKYRRTKVGMESIIQLIKRVRRMPGITRVKLGGGKNKIVTKFWKSLKSQEKELGIKVTENNWIEFVNKGERAP